MLQILPIDFGPVKRGNTSENLLNEIRKIIHSFCRAKKITKKAYNNIMSLIKLQDRNDTIYINYKNSVLMQIITESFRSNRLEKKVINMLLYRTLVFTRHGKI